MPLDKQSIWLEAQNKPSLIVDDLKEYVHPIIVYDSLLRRGIFKWLAVRRDLIKYKDKIKAELREIYPALGKMRRSDPEYWKLRGRMETLEEIRSDIRKMTHSERWRCPDNDSRAKSYLRELESEHAPG